MIEYKLKDSEDNTFSLNGDLVDRALKKSLTQLADSFVFDNKIVERSFLPGSSLIGDKRLASRELSLFFSMTNDNETEFKDKLNEILYWLSKTIYLLEAGGGLSNQINLYHFEGSGIDSVGAKDAVLANISFDVGIIGTSAGIVDGTSLVTITDIVYDNTSVSIWFVSVGDTGRFQTILDQTSDIAIGLQIYLLPVSGHMAVIGQGINTIIETNFIDSIFHRVCVKWDNTNVHIAIDRGVILSVPLVTSLLSNDFNFGQKDGSLHIQDKEFIGQEYTNLADPDMLSVNWTLSNATRELSTLSINGNFFTQIANNAASAGYVSQTLTDGFSNLILTGSIICRKGSSAGNTTRINIVNASVGGSIFNLVIDFDNFGSSPGTPSAGTLLDYTWYDSETLKINFECAALVALPNVIQLQCFGSNNATAAEYTYWTEVQLIDHDEITMFPFVEGIHPIDEITITQALPGRCIIDFEMEPKFLYDTLVNNKTPFNFIIDGTHRLFLFYEEASNKFSLIWIDGTNSVQIFSQEFGGAFTNINQRLRFTLLLNLISGGQTDSSFILTPLESGALNISNSWSGVPDVKTSTFPDLTLGWDATSAQIDSDLSYFDIYNWDGVKPTIANDNDIIEYLKTRGMPLFNFETKDNYIDATQTYEGYNLNGAVDEINVFDKVISDVEEGTLFNFPAVESKQLKVTADSIDIGYTEGALKKDSDNTINFTALAPYWEIETPDSIVGSAIAVIIKEVAITNGGYLSSYPVITLVATVATNDVQMYMTSSNIGLQIQDSAFGTVGNLTMVIDCENGIITINDLNRNVNIVPGTGFFDIPVGSDVLNILSSANITYTIEWKRRYYL